MLYYLATPYTLYAGGIEEAYRESCRQAALLLKAGIKVFSPIAHTHGVAVYGDIDPKDAWIWLGFDRPFMVACDALIMCQMDGWRDSRGMAHELDVFRTAQKPVYWMTPGFVPMDLAS